MFIIGIFQIVYYWNERSNFEFQVLKNPFKVYLSSALPSISFTSWSHILAALTKPPPPDVDESFTSVLNAPMPFVAACSSGPHP